MDHLILLEKMKHYVFRGKANRWIKSHLTERKQILQVKKTESNIKLISSGVPQGSVLGPLLFLIYINDFQDCLKYYRSYILADDNALNIFHHKLKTLKKQLNIDLKMICHWLNSNKIKLNVDKTDIILSRHPTNKVDYDLKIKIQGKRLRFSRSTRYLGIEIDQHLDWKQQQNLSLIHI